MGRPLKIAIVVPDNRDEFRSYADLRPHFGAAPTALMDGLALLPECEVLVVCCVQRPLVAPEKIGPNIFYHTEIVPKWGWMRGGYLGCIRSIRRQLAEIRPDIVHGQGTERYCALSAAFSGFPNVVTIHGNMRAIAKLYDARIGSFNWLAARLETLALARTAGVFCNSAYTESLVRPRARKVWRVANALRPVFFEPANLVSPPVRPVILNIGVMEPRKQQVPLLRVARAWHQRRLDFDLRFVGNKCEQTAYGGEFSRALAQAEADGYARHLGTLPAASLIAAMDQASALIHFPTEESFGLVVAEALARNLKFFGAAIGGITDIASGVEGAELFASGDWSSLQEQAGQWIQAGSPRPVSAAAAMKQRYHPLIIARQHLKIYQEVLNTRL